MWKFLRFHTIGRQPGVIVIPLALPDDDVIHFHMNTLQDVTEALDNSLPMRDIYWCRPGSLAETTIEEFFARYTVTRAARANDAYFVSDMFVPRNEVIGRVTDHRLFVYARRTASSLLTTPICRLQFVSPINGDVYYLRLLMRHFASSSFDNARTVNGQLYRTCRDACIACGLIDDTDEFDVTMKEAIEAGYIGWRLRNLFVVLAGEFRNDASSILERYAVPMSLDLLSIVVDCDEWMEKHLAFTDLPFDIRQHLLIDLRRLLEANGSSLEQLNLPGVALPRLAEVERERSAHDVAMLQTFVDNVTLTPEQRRIVNYINAHCEDNVLINARFGRGKSFVVDYIIATQRIESKIVLVCAPTGIVAIARNGSTIHGLTKMTVDPDALGRLHCVVSDNSQRAELLRQADVLVIDEIANVHRRILEAVDELLRHLRDIDKPFGGMRVIGAGDFRQIPAVIASSDARDIFNACIRSWPCYDTFTELELFSPIRTKGDPEWTAFCDKLGDGEYPSVEPDEDDKWLSVGATKFVDLPASIETYADDDKELKAARDWTHPDPNDTDAVVKAAIVAVTNRQVDEHNTYIMDVHA